MLRFSCLNLHSGIDSDISVGQKLMNQEFQSENENTPVPVMQRVLDNPFLLLFIGVVVPTVFYIIWGIMEIITIPLAK